MVQCGIWPTRLAMQFFVPVCLVFAFALLTVPAYGETVDLSTANTAATTGQEPTVTTIPNRATRITNASSEPTSMDKGFFATTIGWVILLGIAVAGILLHQLVLHTVPHLAAKSSIRHLGTPW